MNIKEFHDFQKEIRQKRMPNSAEIASLAQGVVTIPDDLISNFDATLSRLLFLEKDLYKKFEKECSVQIYKRAFESGLLDIPAENSIDALSKHFDKHYSIYTDLFDSVNQSKKSRSENTFELEFDFLFQKLGLPGELKKSGSKNYIYFFPSEAELMVGNQPGTVMILAKTVRDQWRKFLDLSKHHNISKIFFVTLDERITQSTLWEIASHGFMTATLENIRAEKYPGNSSVVNLNTMLKLINDQINPPEETP